VVLSGELPLEGHLCSTNESICITGNSCCAIRTLVQYPAVTWKIHGYPSRRRACDVMGVLGCTVRSPSKTLTHRRQVIEEPLAGCWLGPFQMSVSKLQQPLLPHQQPDVRPPPKLLFRAQQCRQPISPLSHFFAVERRIF
jgi:hypothetical protein